MAPIAHKVGPKYQVTTPKEVREALGIKAGDLVVTRLEKRGALIEPVDRTGRIALKQDLAEAVAAYRAGRYLGPFTTAKAALRAVKRKARARGSD